MKRSKKKAAKKPAAKIVVRFQGRFTGAWSTFGALILSLDGSWGAGVLDSATAVSFPVEGQEFPYSPPRSRFSSV